jgi:hypothetical protein
MIFLVERLGHAALGKTNAEISAIVAFERRDREVGDCSEIDGQGFPAR